MLWKSRTRFEGNAFAKIVNTGPKIYADGKYNITMFLNSKKKLCLHTEKNLHKGCCWLGAFTIINEQETNDPLN